MIDVIDIKYQVVDVERRKYVCKCGSAVETAPGPERAVDGGRYSLRFGVKGSASTSTSTTCRSNVKCG